MAALGVPRPVQRHGAAVKVRSDAVRSGKTGSGRAIGARRGMFWMGEAVAVWSGRQVEDWTGA
jgi:hypothetical protein